MAYTLHISRKFVRLLATALGLVLFLLAHTLIWLQFPRVCRDVHWHGQQVRTITSIGRMPRTICQASRDVATLPPNAVLGGIIVCTMCTAHSLGPFVCRLALNSIVDFYGDLHPKLSFIYKIVSSRFVEIYIKSHLYIFVVHTS